MYQAHMLSSIHHIEGPFPTPTKLTRRMRPPDSEIAASMDSTAPLRGGKHAKAGRRESRLGFSRFFGRHRVATETEAIRAAPEMQDSEDLEVSGTIGGPPYDVHTQGSQSEVHLGPTTDVDVAMRPRTGIKSPPFTPPLGSPTMPINSKRRGSIAPTVWDPVPLFQAWPQAVRTATLPACLQADSLLRMHNRKEMLPTINHPDLGDEKDMFVAMAKKKHRRNSSSSKLDWTTKIYILVTSGYLLQYAGDGPHDCLPERVVQLTKDSAAFASDVIPGKHWVLQVSSVFEDGALTSHDTRSLLGKFGLREKERRQASDILMIFESAADMDSWMILLRKEIEVLGGKAPLTEIGTPRQEEVATLPMSPAGRPIVTRDPNFGRNNSLPETRWDPAATVESPEMHLDTVFAELLPEHPFYDNSATNSFVSQDGRHLDGLRDSTNRYSFLSAARTMVTSDSSACNSPIRDSFGSGSQSSHPSEDITPQGDELDKAHLRPNAVEIENRRQSYRMSNISFDPNTSSPTHRQHASLSIIQEPLNFSLPNRRRAASHTAADPVHIAHSATAGVTGRPLRRPRRPPPPTLGFTRPLSIVADSPSPSMSSPMLSPPNLIVTGGKFDVFTPPDTPSFFSANWTAETTRPEYDLSSRASSQQSNVTSFRVSVHNSPRKYASMTALRPADRSLWDNFPPQFARDDVSPLSLLPHHQGSDIPRSMEAAGPTPLPVPRSRSPIQRVMGMAAQKRASMHSLTTPSQSSPRGSISVLLNNSVHCSSQSDRCYEPATARSLPSSRRGSRLSAPGAGASRGHSRNGSASSVHSFSTLGSRGSMSQIPAAAVQSFVAGPPPAPPPNKALPPIPTGGAKKRRNRSVPPAPRTCVAHSMASLPGGEF